MQAKNNQALPPGYQLQGYEIRKVLSAGGFSVVYIARDRHDRTVAIKEYLPATLALRNEGTLVQVSSPEVSARRG